MHKKEAIKWFYQKYSLSIFFGVCASFFCTFTFRQFDLFWLILSIAVTFFGTVVLDMRLGLTQKIKQKLKLFTTLTTFVFAFISIVSIDNKIGKNSILPANVKPLFMLVGGIFLFFVVYFLVDIFFSYIKEAWKKATKGEKILFFAYVGLILVAATVMFYFTHFILCPDRNYDLVFNADTGVVRKYGFFNPYSPMEGKVVMDWRHPFAYIATLPFAVVAQLFSYVFFFLPFAFDIGIIVLQGAALCLTGFMMAKMLKLEGWIKYLFLGLFLTFAASFVFVFIIDLYIFGTFWLVWSVYLMVYKSKHSTAPLVVGVGALSTSIAFAPFTSDVFDKKWTKADIGPHIKKFVWDMTKIGLFIIFLICVSGQITQVKIWHERTLYIKSFTGHTTTVYQQWVQYSHFLIDMFRIPAYSASLKNGINTLHHSSIHWFGIVILLLTLAAFAFNYKNRFAQICVYWVFVSIIFFPLIGLGARQDAMFLYAPYFIWAYLGLLFMAANKIVKKLTEKFKPTKYIFAGLCAGLLVTVLVFNIIQAVDIVKFGLKHFKV